MMTPYRPKIEANGLATLIGSLPAANHKEALEWILESTPEIPLWPQLPVFPEERMLNQFNEGLPGIVETGERTYFDVTTDTFADEQLAFYEEYLQISEKPETLLKSRFRTSRDRAAGIYLLARIAHAIGMDSPEVSKLRSGGVAITMFTLLGLAVYAVLEHLLRNPWGRIDEITIRRVLTHEAGLPVESPAFDWGSSNFPATDEVLESLAAFAQLVA